MILYQLESVDLINSKNLVNSTFKTELFLGLDNQKNVTKALY